VARKEQIIALKNGASGPDFSPFLQIQRKEQDSLVSALLPIRQELFIC
jgi:hypothetical protein